MTKTTIIPLFSPKLPFSVTGGGVDVVVVLTVVTTGFGFTEAAGWFGLANLILSTTFFSKIIQSSVVHPLQSL